MVAAIALSTVQSKVCPACGRTHSHRVAIESPDQPTSEALLGFFARCPVTGQRAWLVLEVPQRQDGGSLLIQVGPPDEPDWIPAETTSPVSSLPFGSEPALRPMIALPSPRGMDSGGFRGSSRAPELLRQALGCPLFSRSYR